MSHWNIVKEAKNDLSLAKERLETAKKNLLDSINAENIESVSSDMDYWIKSLKVKQKKQKDYDASVENCLKKLKIL